MGELGVLPHVIDQLLNHTTGGHRAAIGRVYNRSIYLPEMRSGADMWGSHITKLTTPPPTGATVETNVVELRPAVA